MVQRSPQKTPSITSTSPSTQIQAENVQRTELALPATEGSPIHHLKGYPLPVERGQEGKTEARLSKGAKTAGWEGLPRFQVPGLGYQPSSQLPWLNWGLEAEISGKTLLPASVSLWEALPSQSTADRLPTGGGVSSQGQGKKGVGFHRQDKPGVYYRHPINSLLKAERQGQDGSKSQLTGTHGCMEVRFWSWRLRWEYPRAEVLWSLQGDQERGVPHRLGRGAGRVSGRLGISSSFPFASAYSQNQHQEKKITKHQTKNSGEIKTGRRSFLEKERILAQLVRAWY